MISEELFLVSPSMIFFVKLPIALLFYFLLLCHGLPWWLRQQRIHLQCRRPGFNPWVGEIPCRRKWQPTPVFLHRGFHGQRSLAGYSPCSHIESDTTEQLTPLLLNIFLKIYALISEGEEKMSFFSFLGSSGWSKN